MKITRGRLRGIIKEELLRGVSRTVPINEGYLTQFFSGEKREALVDITGTEGIESGIDKLIKLWGGDDAIDDTTGRVVSREVIDQLRGVLGSVPFGNTITWMIKQLPDFNPDSPTIGANRLRRIFRHIKTRLPPQLARESATKAKEALLSFYSQETLNDAGLTDDVFTV